VFFFSVFLSFSGLEKAEVKSLLCLAGNNNKMMVISTCLEDQNHCPRTTSELNEPKGWLGLSVTHKCHLMHFDVG
jgi:hypothetical protein